MEIEEILPDSAESLSAKIDNEKYFIWKKNAKVLYTHLQTTSLIWPSLTVQFMPDVEINDTFNKYRIITGSFTSGQANEELSLHDIRVKTRFDINPNHYDSEKQEILDNSNIPARPTLLQKITHDGEVNKARYMPQNPDLIASISGNGKAYVFDRTKHPSQPSSRFKSEICLDYHKQDGFGLSWNSNKEGELITGASDGLICLYDITKWSSKDEHLQAKVFVAHDNGVNDLKYAFENDSIFTSVGEDKLVKVWDKRKPEQEANVLSTSFSCPVNSVATNPRNQFILAAGDSEGNVKIYDTRNFQQPVSGGSGRAAHESAITCLEWNYHSPSILASGSEDSQVKIWDYSLTSASATAGGDDSHLIFVHGGHLFGVNDLSWNPNDDKMIASVSEDNTLHIWKPAI